MLYSSSSSSSTNFIATQVLKQNFRATNSWTLRRHIGVSVIRCLFFAFQSSLPSTTASLIAKRHLTPNLYPAGTWTVEIRGENMTGGVQSGQTSLTKHLLLLAHYFILNSRLGSSANSFLHRPFLFLPDWLHGLSDHLMILFSWCLRLSRLLSVFERTFHCTFIHSTKIVAAGHVSVNRFHLVRIWN